MPTPDIEAQIGSATAFLGASPLTSAIAELEHALSDCPADEVTGRLNERGVTPELLASAFFVRARFGRINDLIHACAVALTLPHILQPGELLKRPSLAAGNDPTRLWDVETDQRVAEFKLSRWDGHDAGRKRQLFKDLVHLAAADVGERQLELYVLGARPTRFLTHTTSTAAWALNRMAKKTQDLFAEEFGTTAIAIPDFMAGPGARVRIVDLEQLLPQHFAPQAL